MPYYMLHVQVHCCGSGIVFTELLTRPTDAQPHGSLALGPASECTGGPGVGGWVPFPHVTTLHRVLSHLLLISMSLAATAELASHLPAAPPWTPWAPANLQVLCDAHVQHLPAPGSLFQQLVNHVPLPSWPPSTSASKVFSPRQFHCPPISSLNSSLVPHHFSISRLIYSFNKYLLSSYCVPGTVLGSENTPENRTKPLHYRVHNPFEERGQTGTTYTRDVSNACECEEEAGQETEKGHGSKVVP